MNTDYFTHIATSLLLLTLLACNSDTEDMSASENTPVNHTVATDNENHRVASSKKIMTLEGANSELGKRFFIQCQACHTVAAGGDDLIGPNLWGILGRAAGKQDGFQYSEALAKADFVWDLESLDQLLIKPNDIIPNTTMIFAGIPNEKMRRDLLAYLIESTTEQ